MRRRWPAAILALALAAAGAAAGAQEAQPPARPQFLLLDQDRLLTDSRRGQALLAEEETVREQVRAEAREIEAAFETEERALTEQRADLPQAEFRRLADDFDDRVVAARQQQDARAASLAQEFDQKRRQFYADVGPILVGVMEEVGALAIFDQNGVLIADQGLNITDTVVARIDERFPAAPAEAPQAAPEAAPGGDETPAPEAAPE